MTTLTLALTTPILALTLHRILTTAEARLTRWLCPLLGGDL